ncbi:MAG: hypothetical protein ABW189_05760 [Rickettsiales bacterium]
MASITVNELITFNDAIAKLGLEGFNKAHAISLLFLYLGVPGDQESFDHAVFALNENPKATLTPTYRKIVTTDMRNAFETRIVAAPQDWNRVLNKVIRLFHRPPGSERRDMVNIMMKRLRELGFDPEAQNVFLKDCIGLICGSLYCNHCFVDKEAKVALVLGSTVPKMEKRIAHALETYPNAHIAIVTGFRALFCEPGSDEIPSIVRLLSERKVPITEEELQEIAEGEEQAYRKECETENVTFTPDTLRLRIVANVISRYPAAAPFPTEEDALNMLRKEMNLEEKMTIFCAQEGNGRSNTRDCAGAAAKTSSFKNKIQHAYCEGQRKFPVVSTPENVYRQTPEVSKEMKGECHDWINAAYQGNMTNTSPISFIPSAPKVDWETLLNASSPEEQILFILTVATEMQSIFYGSLEK